MSTNYLQLKQIQLIYKNLNVFRLYPNKRIKKYLILSEISRKLDQFNGNSPWYSGSRSIILYIKYLVPYKILYYKCAKSSNPDRLLAHPLHWRVNSRVGHKLSNAISFRSTPPVCPILCPVGYRQGWYCYYYHYQQCAYHWHYPPAWLPLPSSE